MRKITALLVLFLSANVALAQDDDYIPAEEDWFFYDLAHARYLNQPGAVELSPWSNSHSLSLMDDVIFGNSRFGFAYGIGYTSVNYKSNLGITQNRSTGIAEFEVLDDADYDENKLNIKYVELPLELRFRSQPTVNGNFFRFYVGAKFGVRFDSYAHFEEGDYEVSYHHPDELNRWRFGTYTRIGFGHLSLFAYYGLTNIFDYDADPQVYDMNLNGINDVAVGITLSL